MQVIQQTYQACSEMRKILQHHRVVFEERDVFLNTEYADELEARVPGAKVPVLFINGAHIGVSLLC